MKLYWGSGSPFAWRAMLGLIVKGVEFEDTLLEFSKKQHKAPEYLAISPRGKVPALVDGDTAITESLAILAYIDRKVPQPPLFGETAAEAGLINQRVQEHENYLGKATQDVMRPVFRGKVAEQRDVVREAVVSLRRELATFEQLVSNSPWIAGERISAADVVVYPTLCLVDRVASRSDNEELELDVPMLESDFPHLADHKRRFSGLPGVERAHPPHWKS